jgi:hypothetical protein
VLALLRLAHATDRAVVRALRELRPGTNARITDAEKDWS